MYRSKREPILDSRSAIYACKANTWASLLVMVAPYTVSNMLWLVELYSQRHPNLCKVHMYDANCEGCKGYSILLLLLLLFFACVLLAGTLCTSENNVFSVTGIKQTKWYIFTFSVCLLENILSFEIK